MAAKTGFVGGATVKSQLGVNGTTNARIKESDFASSGYSATTIAFVAPDTITDSANGLARFVVNEEIEVCNSTVNSSVFKVKTAAAGTITVYSQNVTAESAGGLFMIRPA